MTCVFSLRRQLRAGYVRCLRRAKSLVGVQLLEIHLACLAGDREVVEELVSGTEFIDARDFAGRTPLMMACRAGSAKVVRCLIEKGADVAAQNHHGTTPLMYAKTSAMGSGDTRVMDVLLAAGADVNQRDRFGRTALEYAETNSRIVIAYLAKKGAIR
jgi:ankyrin repeat protein